MPLSPNEIKERAVAFSHMWAGGNAARVAFLFDLYRQTTSLLPAAPAKRRGRTPSRGG